jgi:hypothetical protein
MTPEGARSLLASSGALGHQRHVLLVLDGAPGIDEFDHLPRFVFGESTGTVEKFEVEIDPILLDVQTPVARVIRRHAGKIAPPGEKPLRWASVPE